jgi:pimeloyl-ACP methyl ester carboxylesterase
MTTPRIACLSSVLFLALSAGPMAGPAMRPCPPDSGQPSGAMCGQISVPENRAVKGGRQIALNIVVLPSRSAAGHADPVFGIAGGPGMASSNLAITYPRLYDALQNDHDIVLVDQRGTGASHPLHCSTVDLTKTPERYFDERLDVKAITACRDRLSKDADLALYGTAPAVADLDDVRKAFGYTKINLLGASYGTRVALEYLRRFEANVRAAVLSGVVSPGYRSGLDGARESQAALDQLFAMCAADAPCQKAFPNLAAEFKTVLAALEKAPVTAAIPIDEKQPPLKVTLTRAVFGRELFRLLHSREDWVALPIAIHAAFNKEFYPFAGLALQRALMRNPAADGMELSVLCAQDLPAYAPAAVTAATAGTFLRDERVSHLKRACSIWPHAAMDPGSRLPVKSAAPVLLISGALDPITPPKFAAEVAAALPSSAHVVIANATHVPANPCVNALVPAFLRAGTVKGLDTACAGNLPAPKFVTAIPAR